MKKHSFSRFLCFLSLLLAFQLVFPLVNASASTTNNVLPPSNLSAQLTTPSDVKLSWSAVYGATGYNVYGIIDGQLKLLTTTTASTSYTFNNLPEGTYTYVMSTLSVDGESGPCAPISVNIVYPNMVAPTTLTNKLQNGNDVVLSWTASQYAQSYNLYQIAEDGEKTLVTSVKALTYTITKAAAETYTYAVSAVNTLYGESSLSNTTQVQVVFPTMTAPSNLTYSLLNGNNITLKWNAVSYATNYKIYQIVDGQKNLISTITGTSITYTNMPADYYVYEVYAYSDRFGESLSGSQATIDLMQITMQSPSNLTYSIKNGNDITLKWDGVSYATAYKIYQIIDGQRVLKSTVVGTTITYTDMPAGDYSYKVYSYSDRFGESMDGNETSFTLVLPIMQAPDNLTYSITNGNDITLKWGIVPYATNYKVYQIVNGQRVLKSTLVGTTVTYSNMSGGDYIYEVYSYSARFGESMVGSETSFTLVLPIMQAPDNLSYSITNGNDITLKWGIVPYATNYKVYQIVNGQRVLKSTLAGTTVTYSNVSGGDYVYEVYSYSTRYGESQQGSNSTFSLVLPVMQSPANVVQTVKNVTDFTLSWETSEYANSYKVYQIINGQKVLKNTVTGKVVSYTNMSPGEYNFEIYSYSTRFGESVEGSNITVILNGQVMEAPANLSYSITNGNDIKLTWSAVPYAISYKIYQVIDGEPVLKQTVTGTYVTFTNMPTDDYNYIVHSVSTLLGESPSGAETTFSLVVPTMTAPGNLAYKIQSGNNVVLTWSAVTYANSYKIYELIDGQSLLKATVSSTTTTLANVTEGNHTYIVNSVSTRFGQSQYGSEISFSLELPVMLAPDNFTYSIVNGNDITLRWNTVNYATAYKIYKIINGEKMLEKTVTGTSVTFTNMLADSYNYEVYSYSDRFGESQEGRQVSIALILPIMQPPTNLINSTTNGNDLTLRWGASNYATAYKVYQIINGEKILKQTVTGLYVTFVNMPAGDYKYEVNSYSNRFGESPIGSTVDFTLIWPVVQPPALTGTVLNINNITLSWKAISWANEYRIYEVTNDTQQLLYKGTALSYKVFNLSEGTHTYKMTAYSTRFGESSSSNELTEIIVYPIMQSPVASLNLLDKTSAQIFWSFVTYANGYNVYEIIDNEPVLLIKNLNNLAYTVTDLSYGDHQYYVTSVSNSFGESEPSNTVIAKLIVDIEPPVTSANAPTDWTNQTPISVTLSSSDKDTGTANTYYSINNGDFIEGSLFTISEEGINKISFYSVDKVGNKEAVQTIYVKIDKTAPVTKSDAPTNWSVEDVLINLTATDTQSGAYKTFYSINGSNYLEGTSFKIQEDGIHKVSFYSVDTMGNIESINTVEVKIDKTAPTIKMELNKEYKLGSTLQLNYTVGNNLSGLAFEEMLVLQPNETTGKVVSNGANIQLDKPGVYTVIVTLTDATGRSVRIEKQFIVYIQANIEVTAKVIKGNNGVFTVRVDLPASYSSKDFDLSTATINGVNALSSNTGYYNQAKLGQFKFERSDFTWTSPEVVVEFRCYINGYLVIGQTTVKVQN